VRPELKGTDDKIGGGCDVRLTSVQRP